MLIAINAFFHPIKFLNSMFHSILLLIDGGIYWAFSQVYQIFIKLADARIFQDAFFSNFARRIYALIGVVMLFYLAYALLNSLIDPDKATSGDKSLTKIAQNIVISLILLGFLPIIFDYAYKIQGIIFKENVIGAIIFGSDSTNSNDISKYGNYMAFTALNPFLNPGNYNVRLDGNYTWFDLKEDLINDGDFLMLPILADWAVEPQETVSESLEPNPDNPDEPEVIPENTEVSLKYVVPLSTICGGVLLYITFSFCLDLGIRIVKFAFCQLIAPVPIVLRMMPNKKGTFDKWLKLTLTVYFEVFIRVGIMYLVIYFFSEIANMSMFKYASSGGQGLIVLAIILMGLLAFAKQAPKMLSDMLGLDSGNIKLGIKDKLKAGGFFTAGAAVGAGGTMLARKVVGGGSNIWKNVKARRANASSNFGEALQHFNNGDYRKSFKSFGKATGNFLGIGGSIIGGSVATVAGTFTGAASGMVNSVTHGGKDAKNFGDLRKAASAGINTATDNANKRASYKANHVNPDNKVRNIPVIGNILADNVDVVKGHLEDIGTGVASIIGLSTSLDDLKKVQDAAKSVKDARKAIDDRLTAILNKDKNKLRSLVTYNVAGVGIFDNYADLQNEMEIMKATGMTSGHNGTTPQRVTSEMLTEISRQEQNMREKMKADLLAGYNLDSSSPTYGNRYTSNEFNSKYDADLKELLTSYRTKAYAGASVIEANIDKSNPSIVTSAQRYHEQAVTNRSQSLDKFVLSGNATELFSKASNDAIKSANNRINQTIATKIERQSKK